MLQVNSELSLLSTLPTSNAIKAHFYRLIQDYMSQGIMLDKLGLIKHLVGQLELDEEHGHLLHELELLWQDLFELKFIQEYAKNQEILEMYLHSHQFLQLRKIQEQALVISELRYQVPIEQNQIYRLALELLAYRYHMSWNLKQPFCSFKIEISSHVFRATLVHGCLSANNMPKLFLRRLNKQSFEINQFVKAGPNSPEALIEQLIQDKKNVVVSGPTGSGKTSLIQAMVENIPSQEHLIILEDTHEILVDREQITYLLANGHQHGHSLKEFCAYALRMSPDRMILGEMRSNEIVPFILAMNTGHRGLLTTVHANSAQDTLARLSMLFSLFSDGQELDYNSILKLICHNIDYVVYMENRKISQVIQVLGCEGNSPYFEYLYRSN